MVVVSLQVEEIRVSDVVPKVRREKIYYIQFQVAKL